MKRRCWLLIVLFAFIGFGIEPIECTIAAGGEESEAVSPVIAELAELPVGLRVTHTPARVVNRPRRNSIPNDWTYRWFFRTEVAAIDRRVTITRFGILAWNGAKWILPAGKSQYNAAVFDLATFTDWYSCPEGKIEPGKPAVDPKNWAGSHQQADFRQKWFFIGTDADGKPCKGEAIVELIVEDKPKAAGGK